MDTETATPSDTSRAPYAELLKRWQALEARLAVLLRDPLSQPSFAAQLVDCEMAMRKLINEGTDAALFVHYQRAQTLHSTYSASHALFCATLCELLANTLPQAPRVQRSLVRSALSMNLGMTQVQDQLAQQLLPPTPEQRAVIRVHAVQARLMLAALHVDDEIWLDTVAAHHETIAPDLPLSRLPANFRLPRILNVIDRYTAGISARGSVDEASVSAAARQVDTRSGDEVITALLKITGHYPPGTFVRLENGETAVVLCRSKSAFQPWVAAVLNRRDEALADPRIRDTGRDEYRIRGPVQAPARYRLRQDLMLALAAEAARP